MERIAKGIYIPEFRAEAVKLVKTTGMSVARTAKESSAPGAALSTALHVIVIAIFTAA